MFPMEPSVLSQGIIPSKPNVPPRSPDPSHLICPITIRGQTLTSILTRLSDFIESKAPFVTRGNAIVESIRSHPCARFSWKIEYMTWTQDCQLEFNLYRGGKHEPNEYILECHRMCGSKTILAQWYCELKTWFHMEIDPSTSTSTSTNTSAIHVFTPMSVYPSLGNGEEDTDTDDTSEIKEDMDHFSFLLGHMRVVLSPEEIDHVLGPRRMMWIDTLFHSMYHLYSSPTKKEIKSMDNPQVQELFQMGCQLCLLLSAPYPYTWTTYYGFIAMAQMHQSTHVCTTYNPYWVSFLHRCRRIQEGTDSPLEWNDPSIPLSCYYPGLDGIPFVAMQAMTYFASISLD